jgi:hypothetical protein
MPEDVEIETRELQETIEELQEERRERQETEKATAWTRYVALSTALLAVFAAIGALQSGTLVNEAMMLQLRASDKWNEYQAARQKDHLYTLHALALVDRGAKPPAPPPSSAARADPRTPGTRPAVGEHAGSQAPGVSPRPGEKSDRKEWRAAPPEQRLRQYVQQVDREAGKEVDLKKEAEQLQAEAAHKMHSHHHFARSVALIQVAIALSAIAALARIRPVWILSLVVGAAGLFFFAAGMLAQ